MNRVSEAQLQVGKNSSWLVVWDDIVESPPYERVYVVVINLLTIFLGEFSTDKPKIVSVGYHCTTTRNTIGRFRSGLGYV